MGNVSVSTFLVYLILSVASNTAIYIVFKWFGKTGINVLPAIVVNYLTAFFIGLCVVPDLDLAMRGMSDFPLWTTGALTMGVIFISVFYLVAVTTQKVGVSVTTIASKMSLALAAVLFVVSDPAESFTIAEIIAMVFAIAGVVLSSMEPGSFSLSGKRLLWPLIILAGCTVIDFGIAHFSTYPRNPSELALYSCLSFGMAGACGMAVLIVKAVQRSFSIRRRDMLAGFLLGIVNYGSVYFLVKSYDSEIMAKSTLLPVNNLAVVILGTLAAVFLFREKLSRTNYVGVLLSLVALVLLLSA